MSTAVAFQIPKSHPFLNVWLVYLLIVLTVSLLVLVFMPFHQIMLSQSFIVAKDVDLHYNLRF